MQLLQIFLQAEGGGMGMNMIFLVGMIAVFYFFMIRPQQQKQGKQRKFLEELKKGDQVVTSGGIYGRIVDTQGDKLILEIDRGTKITINKSYISQENTALLIKEDTKKSS